MPPTLPPHHAWTSDKPSYVAHGLALLHEMRTWGVVRQGGVPGTGIIGTTERAQMCYAKRPANHTRVTAATYPDKESTLWRGFSSAMPARIRPSPITRAQGFK